MTKTRKDKETKKQNAKTVTPTPPAPLRPSAIMYSISRYFSESKACLPRNFSKT